MALTRTFPTDSAGLPLADTRLLVAAMVESDTTGKPRAGVLPSHYNPLVAGTTGMAYSVATFAAVTARSGMGAELVANDGAATVATMAAPGANSRIDVIWVRSLFATYADGSSAPVFGVTQGVAAASPLKPSIPAGALELATAVVLSTTTQTSTAVITQTHPYTAMEGGVVAVRNGTELQAWTPADGSLAYQVGIGRHFFRVGGAWRGNQAVRLNEWHVNVAQGSPGGRPLAPGGVTTLTVAEVPYARSLKLTVLGGVLVSSAGDGGVSVAPSAGAWAGGANSHRVQAASNAQFTDIAYVFFMQTLPANTPLTLTMQSMSSVTAGYDLHFTLEEL